MGYEGSFAGAEEAGPQPTEGITHDGASAEAETKPEIKYAAKGKPSRHAGDGHDMNPQ